MPSHGYQNIPLRTTDFQKTELMRAKQCKHVGRTPSGKEAGYQGEIYPEKGKLDLLVDLSEHESSKDNNVDGDHSPRLLSPTHHQVAGGVDGMLWCSTWCLG